MQAHNVTTIRPQGALSGNATANAPETEGFDFMSYFLGLQADGAQSNVSDGLAGLIPKGDQAPTEGVEDPLLALFQKNKNGGNSWNPMFPNLVPGTVNNQILPGQSAPAGEARQVGQPVPFGMDGKAQAVSGRQVKAKNDDATALPLSGMTANGAPQSFEMAGQPGTVDAQGKGVMRNQGELSPNSVAANGLAPGATIHAHRQAQGLEKAETGTNGTPLTQSLLHPFAGKGEVAGTEKKGKSRESSDAIDDLVAPGAPGQNGGISQAALSTKAELKASEAKSVPELFKNVESMVHNGGGKMTVSLSPQHLGQVEIQVTTRGKKVEIEIKSSSDLAKHAIESRLSDLKQSLHGQDLQLSKVEVQVGKEVARTMTGNSFASLAGNQSFTGQSSHFSNGNSNGGQRFANSHGTTSASQRLSALEASAPMRGVTAGNGRVDIRI